LRKLYCSNNPILEAALQAFRKIHPHCKIYS
jgi:hypothetical protein